MCISWCRSRCHVVPSRQQTDSFYYCLLAPQGNQGNDENAGVNAAGKKVKAGGSREKDRQTVERVRSERSGSDVDGANGHDAEDA